MKKKLKKQCIEMYMYDPLMEFTNVLITIINELPNVDEIKDRKDYKKAYGKYDKKLGEYFSARIAYLDSKVDDK